jgi:integrase/recombinase XerD
MIFELRVVGKGNKERSVFIGEPAADAIRAYLAERPGIAEVDPLFVTMQGRRMTERQLWCIFRDFREAAGFKGVTPHTLRHSFATHMLENGADIVTLKELLGHTSIATTQIYTNVSKSHMRKVFQDTHPRAKLPTA